ncbi:unnamed protein product [Linum trigynum]|uniref:B box-type domain-containing protein n=1 Tax=Linum trigynum TaxID=586398 RepID=A0AAV2C8S0_9ROSI
MKECELCQAGGGARVFCESDQASLCWDCDEKVHGANFLVAKHSRILLCHVCHFPTPWTASGPKLGHTVSFCDSCFSLHGGDYPTTERSGDDGGEGGQFDIEEDEQTTTTTTTGEDEGFSDDEYGTDEEDGDLNQVVPWSGESSSGAEDESRPAAAQ